MLKFVEAFIIMVCNIFHEVLGPFGIGRAYSTPVCGGFDFSFEFLSKFQVGFLTVSMVTIKFVEKLCYFITYNNSNKQMWCLHNFSGNQYVFVKRFPKF